jgi:uncharacterized protein
MERNPAGLSPPVTHTHHEPGTGGRGGAPQPPADEAEELLAALGYLGTVFFSFLPALIIYLVKRDNAPYLRYHAAQAVNLAVTVLLFNLCAFIVGAMLALDSLTVSLSVALPVATVVWLVSVGFCVRAALATARGEPYDLPRWLCAAVLRLTPPPRKPGSADQPESAGQPESARRPASVGQVADHRVREQPAAAGEDDPPGRP